MRPLLRVFPDAAGLARAAAEAFVEAAEQSVAARGRFCVALPGGSTPKELFLLLAEDPFRDAVPWTKTQLFWGDERCVAPESPETNFALARDTLLSRIDLPGEQVHRVDVSLPPAEAAAAYSALLKEVLGADGLDLVLLGMGADGHTASLFPGTEALYAAQRGAIDVYVPQLETWRVTLTLPEINQASEVVFLVSGAAKAKALAAVSTGVSGLPAERVRPERGTLVWLADLEAAAEARLGVGMHLLGASTPVADADGLKRRAAEAAVELVGPGMAVGLGTGSTARWAVEAIGRRLAEGELRDVVGIATSEATAELARRVGIPLVSLAERPELDLAIDGADEISPGLDLIKGMGGALLREKIVATAARRLVVVADSGKCVSRLGRTSALPLAVVPFGWELHVEPLRALGAEPVLRRRGDGTPVTTDDGLYLLDCRFDDGIDDPTALDEALHRRPGIVESGLFLQMADTAFVADGEGVHVLWRQM